MPIYTYLCEGGHTFEDFVPTMEKTPEGPACPEADCGRPSRKVPSGFSAKVVRGTPTHFPNRKENK